MRFEYTGRHIEVTPALRSHVEDHFSRIRHLFNGNSAKAHVIISVERGHHRSEIIVNWRREVLTATTTKNDMYQSLSQSVAKIEKQALKLKNKVVDKTHRAVKVGEATSRDGEVKPAPPSRRIINARRYAVKPMTAQEAAMRLVEEENQFLVFRNSDDQRLGVIYKRKDGNFGLIQP
ncbi:MAG TPA: ribosome-associated translation inhibitor RaiA [Pyrinomonadaceae bacterium]|jgi:putative sigma-54 modulation protein